MKVSVQFTLNGKPVDINVDDERKLLWLLRTDFNLTGTKYGCGEGICGACTVIIDGKNVRSCKTSIRQIIGKDVVTIEGLAQQGRLHPLQQAFIDHGAFQCGYCTSGMLMDAVVFLKENPKPSHSAVINHMEHNLCRCGAHKRIVEAVEAVANSNEIS